MALESPLHRLFCHNLRRLRLESDLTQVMVSERMGITQPQYTAIECGRNTPSLKTIERAAAAIGCKPEDLLSAKKQAKKIPQVA